MERVKKELVLEGLCCANCASKIEISAKKIDGINEVTLNFITKTLSFETENEENINNYIEEICKIVDRIEPDVKVKLKEDISAQKSKDEEDEVGNKKDIIKIIIASILFVSSLALKLPAYIEIVFLILSYLIVGAEVLIRAVKNIIKGQVFDENFLMAIATIGALGIKEYPEAVAVMLFYQIGEFFQDLAVHRSRKSISELMDIRPDYANLETDSGIIKVSPEEVGIGEIIIVKPGEKIPLDGKIIEGSSLVDTTALTGESLPREVEEGKIVLSGFVNKTGLIKIEVEKGYGESTVSKILDLVQNASNKKAQTENFITKFAKYYTPIVVVLAVLLAVIPPIITGGNFQSWLYKALSFLVVSCPCALVISVPLSFFGGIGSASKHGILIKGSNYLEALNKISTVVFDKTGTLTKGNFVVTEVNAAKEISNEELLEYAALSESYSNHPIALSIQSAYGKEIDKSKLENYEEIPGYGVKVKVEDKEIFSGNIKLMKEQGISFIEQNTIGTVIHVAVDKNYIGNIVIADEIKKDSKEAIQGLKDIGIDNIIMLTGDSKNVADKVGNSLGIGNVYSELLPHEKVDKIEGIFKENKEKGKIVFVGDGINDAPVLARADIGIAMGALGSDAAIEAADVVIMTDEPSKIVTAIRIANKTRKIVWQNIIFALGVKIAVLILVAAGIATMWEAVFADVGVALIAVLNALRVLSIKKKK